MNSRIIKLIFVGWVVAFICVVTVPIVTAMAPSASVSAVTSSQVWHHRRPSLVGQEVRDLAGEPRIGGWMPFLHSAHIMREVDGEWELTLDAMAARIRVLVPDVKAAGYLMLDAEGALKGHENLHLYITAIKFARQILLEEGVDAKIGYYRMPDHVGTNQAGRFFMLPVFRHADAAFVSLKNTNDYWVAYLKDVRQAAPHHAHVVYMDAYDRNTGQLFPRETIIERVRLAQAILDDPEIVFRQQDARAAQAMVWVAQWLDDEAADG